MRRKKSIKEKVYIAIVELKNGEEGRLIIPSTNIQNAEALAREHENVARVFKVKRSFLNDW
ncbi:hypothetical protein [Listeria booriae]|uniref:hypothetical protein n=1 Tax=Listeria booriae TaxID=1552123 RepID=UPI00162388A5|nr:hypothetical protein [Listeria booriae]MBC2258900.1 hypothetical protein [Listeria booriae]